MLHTYDLVLLHLGKLNQNKELKRDPDGVELDFLGLKIAAIVFFFFGVLVFTIALSIPDADRQEYANVTKNAGAFTPEICHKEELRKAVPAIDLGHREDVLQLCSY